MLKHHVTDLYGQTGMAYADSFYITGTFLPHHKSHGLWCLFPSVSIIKEVTSINDIGIVNIVLRILRAFLYAPRHNIDISSFLVDIFSLLHFLLSSFVFPKVAMY